MKNLLLFLLFIVLIACKKDEPFFTDNSCNYSWELPNVKGFELSAIDMSAYKTTFKQLQFVSNTVGFAYAGNERGGYIDIFKTTDGGDTWRKLSTGLDLWAFGVRFKNENVGFVTGYSATNVYLYKTTDGGETWERNEILEYEGNFRDFEFDKDGNLYTLFFTADGVRQLLKSSDDGKTWNKIYHNDNIEPTVRYSFKIYDDYILALGTDGRIFKLDLNGNLLKTIQTPEGYIYNVQVFDENTMLISGRTALFKTVDGGLHWENISEPPSSKNVIISALSENEFLITRSKGACPIDYSWSNDVFAYTTDGGQSWEESHVSVNLTYYFESCYKLPNGDYLMLGHNEMVRVRKK